MVRRIISAIGFLTIMFVFQTLESFGQQPYPVTIQGSLKIDNVPANGLYDIEVLLRDAPVGGINYGSRFFASTLVTNGIFTVTGSFGQIEPLPSEQWLEFHVRPSNGNGVLVTLLPRQRIMYAPLAVNAVTAVNALNLGGISSSQFVQMNDVRLSDARNPLPGSPDYIQNTANSQSGSFNLNGTGTADTFNAAAQFSINGNRILSAGGADNIFAGFQAGQSNTTGASNAFFGVLAGNLNTIGNSNSFFGRTTGRNNLTGNANSFFGNSAGVNNTSGSSNSFFGTDAGFSNTTGIGNTIIGGGANVGGANLTNASAFGYRAYVTQSNSLVLGGINGINGANADTNVGIGLTAPTFKLQVVDQSNKGLRVQANTPGGTVASFGALGAFQIDSTVTLGARMTVAENGNVGIGTSVPGTKLHVVGQEIRLESRDPNSFPRFSLDFTSGAIDQKRWQNYASLTALNFSTVNDTETGESFWLQVNRGAGTSIASVVFPNGNVGIGNTNPTEKLRVTGTGLFTGRLTVNGGINYFDTSGNANFFMKSAGAANGINFGVVGVAGTNSVLYISQYDGATYQDRLIIDTFGVVKMPRNVVIGTDPNVDRLYVNGTISVNVGTFGTQAVCRNTTDGILTTCSSSIRYKQNVKDYKPGLELIRRLHPVSFNWKVTNEADFGLVAEEVAEVEPLMIIRNDKGEIEGVKYDRVGVVLVNAVNEQQDQIEAQQKQIDEQKTQTEVQQRRIDSQAEVIRQQQETLDKQQSEIEALKAIVCANNPTAKICEEKKP